MILKDVPKGHTVLITDPATTMDGYTVIRCKVWRDRGDGDWIAVRSISSLFPVWLHKSTVVQPKYKG